MKEKSNEREISRRTFLRYAGIMGTGLAMSKMFFPKNAHALNVKRRLDATGKAHILACVPGVTSTGGYWDNSDRFVASMKSGEIIHIETGNHLHGHVVPGTTVEEWRKRYLEEKKEYADTTFYPDDFTGVTKKSNKANHTHLTGPVEIEGAMPGDFLQIEILEIVPRAYGFNVTTPKSMARIGLLPDDFPDGKLRHYYVDTKKNYFEFQEGINVPLAPFPGTIGVELDKPGRWSNIPPGKHGGNFDNPDHVAGTVLYIPVWSKGAGLKTGDSHLAQADECNVSALEGNYQHITLRVTIRKDLNKLLGKWPFCSTPTHWMTMGLHVDLWKSCQMSRRLAIDFLNKYYGMDKAEAYSFCSMAAPLKVTQLCDKTLGMHTMIPKDCFVGKQYRGKDSLLIPPQK